MLVICFTDRSNFASILWLKNKFEHNALEAQIVFVVFYDSRFPSRVFFLFKFLSLNAEGEGGTERLSDGGTEGRGD
jgi:hypothetical protein